MQFFPFYSYKALLKLKFVRGIQNELNTKQGI